MRNELFKGFSTQMEEKLTHLDSLNGVSNSEDYRAAAHAIKSMSANMGAEIVRQIAAELESAARRNEDESYPQLTRDLKTAYAEFSTAFETEFGVNDPL